MNIKALVGIVVLLAVVVGGWWVYTHNPAPADAAATQTVQASTFSEDAQYSTIKVQYPTAPANERATMEAEMGKLVADFKQNVDGLDATVLPSLADGHKLTFTAEYKQYSSADTSSYLYTVFEDTGGAHPNTYFKTFVFDKDGTQVGIKDVVGPDLTKLSQLVTADVTAQVKQRLEGAEVGDSIFPEGLTPTENNYSNFVIDGDTLVIEIPPYQVAAYVMGSFEVRIPHSAITQ